MGGASVDAERGARPVLLCIGDGRTGLLHQNNYVSLLQQRPIATRFDVVDEDRVGGVSNLLERFDRIIEHSPDVVTILIGEPDPAVGTSRQVIDGIVKRLQDATDARLALLEIPKWQRDSEPERSAWIDQSNDDIRVLGYVLGVPVLSYATVARVERSSIQSRARFIASTQPLSPGVREYTGREKRLRRGTVPGQFRRLDYGKGDAILCRRIAECVETFAVEAFPLAD